MRATLISETRSLIRAAADGDADSVRALLAEGADVNAVSERGQTALMLAAIFGRDEIASLLLDAGADASMKDSLGLTATEWSVRRGFSSITRLIGGPAAPALPRQITETTSSTTNERSHEPVSESEIDSKPEVDAPEIKDNPPARFGAAGMAMLKARAAQTAEFDSQIEEPIVISSSLESGLTAGTGTEQFMPATPEADGAGSTTEDELTKPRIDAAETAGEVRRVVEQVAARSDENEIQTSIQPLPVNRPSAAVTKAPPLPMRADAYELPVPEHTPRWTGEASSFSQLPAHRSAHALLWILIVITLGSAAFITYRLTRHSFDPAPHPAAVTTKREEPKVTAAKPLPVVGGALTGAELEVVDPEYPSEAVSKDHHEGVSGTVTVQVEVNRKGKVISTRVLSGDQALRATATKAARRATFVPEKLQGNATVVKGTITYTFVAPRTEPATASVTSPETDLPVTGDDLAGTELSLPKAEYPESAKTRGVSGTITVKVRVNREGKVISWLTSKGDAQLRAAALKAAKKSTFAPGKLPGTGEVVGTITYNFK